MIMLLNKKEEQEMVLQNQKLVRLEIKRIGVTPASSDYEDLFSIGTIGLLNAIRTFDESKGYAFSSYACKCIRNEIFLDFKRSRKHSKEISLNNTIYEDKEGKSKSYEDVLEDPMSEFDERIINREYFVHLMNIILNYLESKERLVMIYKMENTNLSEIGRLIGVSRQRVFQINEKAVSKIKKVLDNDLFFNEVFKFQILENYYQLSFNPKDINHLGEEFEVKDLITLVNLYDNNIELDGEQIVISALSEPEFFKFIGKIFQMLDKLEESRKYDNITNSDKSSVSFKNSNSECKKTSRRRKIINYILSLKYFTIEDLKEYFSEFSQNQIRDALHWSKCKGLITSVSRGKYVVNKS